MARTPVPLDARSDEEKIFHLVLDHTAMARSMAGRYRGRGVDLDDLQQVALLGLVQAARRFDPHTGHDFRSFAVPTIRGELRRHFRDRGWMVRPPRRVQELQFKISTASSELSTRLGRSPRPSELAVHLDTALDDVIEALAADGCFTPVSLDLSVGDGDGPLGELIPAKNRDLEQTEARLVVAPMLSHLDDRDRRIVTMRFWDDLTQNEIADVIGVSQAQVSRTLTRILDEFRDWLGSNPSAA